MLFQKDEWWQRKQGQATQATPATCRSAPCQPTRRCGSESGRGQQAARLSRPSSRPLAAPTAKSTLLGTLQRGCAGFFCRILGTVSLEQHKSPRQGRGLLRG